MQDEERKLLDDIFNYIFNEMEKEMEDGIFQASSLVQLGKEYYSCIINSISGANTELVNKVIGVVGKRDTFDTQDDYYLDLVETIGYKFLPSEILPKVRAKYDDIFVLKYNLVKVKYQTEINRINNELDTCKNEIETIKNKPASKSFVYDISNEEKRLYELCTECNNIRTRKEMLEYIMQYVELALLSYCNRVDSESIENAIKLTVLSACRQKNEKMYELYLSYYEDCLDVLEYDIDNPYAAFYKIKMSSLYDEIREAIDYYQYYKPDEEQIRYYEELKNKIPKVDELKSIKETSKTEYIEVLDRVIGDFQICNKMVELITKSVCLRSRRNILLKSIEMFCDSNYEIFDNIVPIQIEGVFADYLRDSSIFIRFSHLNVYENAVLKDKIQNIESAGKIIYPEAVEYFKFFFNNIIRNRIAHGRYISTSEKDDEIFAKELLLDLYQLISMITRTSEIEKMYRFVHGYQNNFNSSKQKLVYEALFNDLIGKKIIASYGGIESYRPIQVVYWLLNPYYEKIYEQVSDNSELFELRMILLNKDFWQYVLEKLSCVKAEKFDFFNIDNEFASIVRGMFNSGISDETKSILKKVNSALKEIRGFNK